MKNTHLALAERLGHTFKNPKLLSLALTHRSAIGPNNERLEFLGDGALNFVIAAELFRLRPDLPEGDLSRLRATLVRGKTLTEIAAEVELADLLIMGEGELRSGGFQRGSIQADAVEALIGAVYMDTGFDDCQRVVLKLYRSRLAALPAVEDLKDPKTKLQEYLQGRGRPLPGYEVLEKWGKPHEQHFKVRCFLQGSEQEFVAEGLSRRRAEQTAAAGMFALLTKSGAGK